MVWIEFGLNLDRCWMCLDIQTHPKHIQTKPKNTSKHIQTKPKHTSKHINNKKTPRSTATVPQKKSRQCVCSHLSALSVGLRDGPLPPSPWGRTGSGAYQVPLAGPSLGSWRPPGAAGGGPPVGSPSRLRLGWRGRPRRLRPVAKGPPQGPLDGDGQPVNLA